MQFIPEGVDFFPLPSKGVQRAKNYHKAKSGSRQAVFKTGMVI
jgi:hypothetical protein